MAFHEQHEQKCPFCGERISATAPKCFNCGRFVDEDEDEEDTEAPSLSGGQWFLILVVGLLSVGLGIAVFYWFV